MTTQTFSAAVLKNFAAQMFTAAGVATHEAEIVAESLVQSNLSGHDSHGVMRVGEYINQLKRGDLVAGAEFRVVAETDSMLAIDGGLGFGQVQAVQLIDRLTPKARQQGIACGTMCNCGHVGRLGEWVERVARDGLAGLMAVNDNGVLKCVAPPGGIEPRISTNPIAIGVPTGGEPLVLDISTSVVANGKIRVAQLANRQCPPGWLLDSEGNPTTDPNVRFTDPRGSILPMGGEDHGYKGFGLGLLFDMLVGGLSGGQCPPADDGAPAANNVLLIVWDPARFHGSQHFLNQADTLIDYVRSARCRQNTETIRLPGDHSTAVRRQRLDEGIPIDDGLWEKMTRMAGKLGVACP